MEESGFDKRTVRGERESERKSLKSQMQPFTLVNVCAFPPILAYDGEEE